MRPAKEDALPAASLIAKEATFGSHMVARLRGVAQQTLIDSHLLQQIAVTAFARIRIPVREFVVRHSNASGLSLLALFEDAHLVIHTYPKTGLVLVDVYTMSAQPILVINAISVLMNAEQVESCDVGVKSWD